MGRSEGNLLQLDPIPAVIWYLGSQIAQEFILFGHIFGVL